MSGIDVQEVRSTYLYANGNIISESVSNVDIYRDPDGFVEHTQIAIRFVPMFGDNGKVLVAETMKYMVNSAVAIKIVSTNTGETLNFLGYLIRRSEKLDSGNEWCGEHEWTFAVKGNMSAETKTPESVKTDFNEALNLAKDLKNEQ